MVFGVAFGTGTSRRARRYSATSGCAAASRGQMVVAK
jgi:hypothetical protein